MVREMCPWGKITSGRRAAWRISIDVVTAYLSMPSR